MHEFILISDILINRSTWVDPLILFLIFVFIIFHTLTWLVYSEEIQEMVLYLLILNNVVALQEKAIFACDMQLK